MRQLKIQQQIKISLCFGLIQKSNGLQIFGLIYQQQMGPRRKQIQSQICSIHQYCQVFGFKNYKRIIQIVVNMNLLYKFEQLSFSRQSQELLIKKNFGSNTAQLLTNQLKFVYFI
ncbi:unnamed protein product [Paramecium primaurelia]|uniref:Uncharacterized protein n=1 Tax=Paramecium primaurelia TaxID=5886 RepID=A0A8S1PHA8_PARPR|nr:unnamed protein product [Paramecium primaurelia]